jgi:hypothetical protein
MIQEIAPMGLNEIKEQIKANVKWETERPVITGGQSASHCRVCPSILISEELDIKITVGYHRSSMKNKELAFTLFELALDELIY